MIMEKLCVILICLLVLLGCGPVVEPGQVWIYTFNKGNPFLEPIEVEYEVLEVKEGWVKYQKAGDNFERTERISWFTVVSELKEKTK